MLSDQNKKALVHRIKKKAQAEMKYDIANEHLVATLRYLHKEGASYSELGSILGVSRQRIHQLVKGV